MPETIVLTRYADVLEAYRNKDFQQSLYDAGEVVMADVLVTLHGDAHRARRRLENRLFRRDIHVQYERALFPAVIDDTVKPFVAEGRADLVHLGHHLMMNLAALTAGVDRPLGTPDETSRLYRYLMKFIEGATLGHSTRPKAEVEAEVRSALADFDTEFLDPSIARRRALITRLTAGEIAEDELPRDILTVLLRNQDNLALPPDVVTREIAFFLLAGAHTSATAFGRCLHAIWEWIADHPDDESLVTSDRLFVQRCVHETIRLNPSSPTGMRRALVDARLRSGIDIHVGDTVVFDLISANRDPSVFGPDAAEFNPHRQLPEGVGPYGLSFGSGMHACIGQELAAGLVPDLEGDGRFDDHLFGLATVAVQKLFDHGARPDPARPPVMDANTRRPYWASYGVIFTR